MNILCCVEIGCSSREWPEKGPQKMQHSTIQSREILFQFFIKSASMSIRLEKSNICTTDHIFPNDYLRCMGSVAQDKRS